MKVELIKQIKENGDVYYATFVDGVQMAGTITYAGNLIEKKEDAVEKAMGKLRIIEDYLRTEIIPSESIMFSEKI
ncbi:MAG TPA: hypothetical protein PLW74_01590 [Candidatus Dojkabacteria bacterium]|nr:hypothetical protein [Candidatus Dojkabacteria bacterium]